MPRHANGPQFSITSIEGELIAELLGASESDEGGLIEMLFLRLHGGHTWHRFFLQAKIGFWEELCREEAFCDYEDLHIVDLAALWKLRDQRIVSAACEGGTWGDATPSSIHFTVSRGEIVLELLPPGDFDADSVVRFEPSSC